MFANVTGLILAGGLSSRFGSDKALASLGGRSLLEESVMTLRPWVSDIAVAAVGGSSAEKAAQLLGLRTIADRAGPAKGPLAGILAGLEWSEKLGAQLMASLPCDVVGMPADAFTRLREASNTARGAYAVSPDGPQSLCAIWPVSSKRVLEAAFASGTHPPVHQVLSAMQATAVRFHGTNIFLNINTQADLVAARKALSY